MRGRRNSTRVREQGRQGRRSGTTEAEDKQRERRQGEGGREGTKENPRARGELAPRSPRQCSGASASAAADRQISYTLRAKTRPHTNTKRGATSAERAGSWHMDAEGGREGENASHESKRTKQGQEKRQQRGKVSWDRAAEGQMGHGRRTGRGEGGGIEEATSSIKPRHHPRCTPPAHPSQPRAPLPRWGR